MSFSWHCLCFLSNKDFWESRESDPWLPEGEVDVYEVVIIGISDDHRGRKSRDMLVGPFSEQSVCLS